jgi:hypothetical protein
MAESAAADNGEVKSGDAWLRRHLINQLAKKLSSEEGQAKDNEIIF